MSRRRAHRTSSPSASIWRFHVAGTGSALEDAKPIDEVYHEITTSRVVFRVLYIAGGNRTGDIASLLQDIVDLETECPLVIL